MIDLEHICYGCFQEKPDGDDVCPHCGFDQKEEMPFLALPVGTILNGRYLTGKVLGVGGFGITYLGYDLTLEIRVAIKEYMPSGLATRQTDRCTVTLTGRTGSDYQSGMERFLDEARILAKLQDTPNIVSVQNYFKENNTAYFVMEYIEGTSLKEFLASQGGKIPCDQALTILQPVMEALVQVHALNLTHRDISPDNIYITSTGESKLLDFGAARFTSGDEKSVSVILKHGYAPEEQYSSHGNQGPWTDVYAMGATLYRCLTGTLPPDSIERIHNDTLQMPTALGIQVPQKVEKALGKALQVKAAERFQNMEEFIQALNGTGKISLRNERAGLDGTEKTKKEKKDRNEYWKEHPGMRKLWLAACIVLILAGVLQIVHGLGLLSGGSNTKKLSSDTPAVTSEQNTSQSPGNSKGIKMTEYESTYYNAVMKIPDSFAKTEDGVFEFVSENGSNIDLSYYTSNSGFPVYELSDLETNKEIYVDYYVSSHSDEDIQSCDIVDAGSRTVGNAAAYQLCFETTDSQGATKQILAVFIEGTNGYGCYQIVASYPKEDSQTKDEVLASIDTFQSNGKSEVLDQLFTDERLPYKFLYMETHAPGGVQVMENEDGEYNAIVYPVEGDEITLLLVVTLPEGYGSSDEILSAMIEGLNEGFPNGKEDIVFPIDAGGYTWKMQEYDCGEQGVCIQNAAVEMDGTFFYLMMITTEETRDTVYGIMFDVMDSIRPTT